MTTLAGINSAVTSDAAHKDHIICCKKPSSDFQKRAAVVNGAVGVGLVTWGMAEIIKALAVCGTAFAAWYGAGIVLLALAAILWVAYSVIQYKSAESKENGMKELEKKNIELQSQVQGTPTTVSAVASKSITVNPYL